MTPNVKGESMTEKWKMFVLKALLSLIYFGGASLTGCGQITLPLGIFALTLSGYVLLKNWSQKRLVKFVVAFVISLISITLLGIVIKIFGLDIAFKLLWKKIRRKEKKE